MNPSGTGLGLYICKLICRSLNGDITLYSEPDLKTVFTFWVAVKPINFEVDALLSATRAITPIKALSPIMTKSMLNTSLCSNAMQAHQPSKFGALKDGQKLSILVADDVYYNLEALKIVFKNLGLISYCKFMTDGRQLIKSCITNVEENCQATDLVTIVIADYEMPIYTGVEAIKEIKAFYKHLSDQAKSEKLEEKIDTAGIARRYRMPTFCMISQYQFAGFNEFAKANGVDYILQKPPDEQ